MFWPTQAFNQFDQDPINVGIRGLPVGLGILAGACICLWALSQFRGHIRTLMVVSSIFMTAGCGAMAVAKVDNMNTLWVILVIASLGIGGIVVPGESIFNFSGFHVRPTPSPPSTSPNFPSDYSRHGVYSLLEDET